MPTQTCKGCGRITNSTTSNWWNTKDYIPTECYMAFEDGRPVKGCAYDKVVGEYKKWIDEIISKNPWEKKDGEN